MTGIRIVPSGAPLYVGAIPPGIQVAQSSGAASPLLTDLAAYWKLDETSGIRFDSAGTNNLTDNGGVGSVAGKIGNAATSFGTATYLSNSSTVGQVSGPLTVALWVNTGSDVTGNQVIISRATTSVSVVDYILDIFSSSIRYILYTSSGTYVAGATITTNTTYFVVFWYDGTNANISLNNGTVTSTASPGTPKQELGAELTLGIRLDSGRPFNGNWIDEVGIWNRVLTVTERSQLYNSGSGITYPFT
jgi:hypothetical protein